MPGRVDAKELRARVARLRALGEQKRAEFVSRQMGTCVEAVLEARSAEGWRGLSENYIPLLVADVPEARVGARCSVRLTEAGPRFVRGEAATC